MIRKTTFRRCLLLGIAGTGRKTFPSHGSTFHGAFQRALHFGSNSIVADVARTSHEMLESFDPVFGVYKEAEKMILDGMRDCIVTLEGPQLVHAQFRLSAGEARQLVLKHAFPLVMLRLGREMAAGFESR